MERLEFKRSRARLLGLVIIAVAFVAGGWVMATTADENADRAMGWVGVVFFGLCALIGIRRIVQGGVAFVFDREGIRSTDGLIAWSEIARCEISAIRRTRYLTVAFRDPDSVLARLPARKRSLAMLSERLGKEHWAFSFAGLRPGLNEALKFIRDNAPGVEAPVAE